MFNNPATRLSAIKFKKMGYPVIFLVFMLIAAVLFILAARFLYRNINSALVINEGMLEARLTKIDFDNFHLITKRLRVEPDIENNNSVSTEENKELGEVVAKEENTEEKETEKVSEKIDIAALRISVLNEGSAAGSAGKVADMLAEKGYENAQSGNGEEKNRMGNTIAYHEERFKSQVEVIQALLKGMNITAETREASAENEEEKSGDIVILLGK